MDIWDQVHLFAYRGNQINQSTNIAENAACPRRQAVFLCDKLSDDCGLGMLAFRRAQISDSQRSSSGFAARCVNPARQPYVKEKSL